MSEPTQADWARAASLIKSIARLGPFPAQLSHDLAAAFAEVRTEGAKSQRGVLDGELVADIGRQAQHIAELERERDAALALLREARPFVEQYESDNPGVLRCEECHVVARISVEPWPHEQTCIVARIDRALAGGSDAGA